MIMEKVRFGVVGTNFITDWMLAGGCTGQPFRAGRGLFQNEGEGGSLCCQVQYTPYFHISRGNGGKRRH